MVARVVPMIGLACGLSACATLVNPPPAAPDAAVMSSSLKRDIAIRLPRAAAPPLGFIGFCKRSPDQCAVPEGSPHSVEYSAETWKALEEVNTSVNLSMTFENDKAHYGLDEFWTIPTDGYGDCDDYVLTKRRNLVERGFPVSALPI